MRVRKGRRRGEGEGEEKTKHKANEMPQWVKALAIKLDYLRLFIRVYMAERENQVLQVVF